MGLPFKTPLGDSEQFQLPVAAELAVLLATKLGASMRKTKRILLKVEMAMRCYSDRPIDAPMLVYLAFEGELSNQIDYDIFRRAGVTPENGLEICDGMEIRNGSNSDRSDRIAKRKYNQNIKIDEDWPELLSLSDENLGVPNDGETYQKWAKVHFYFAKDYMPSHRRYLEALEQILISEEEV